MKARLRARVNVPGDALPLPSLSPVQQSRSFTCRDEASKKTRFDLMWTKSQRIIHTGRGTSHALFVIALVTRFYRLGVPSAVVFDEMHFGRFMEALLRRDVCAVLHFPFPVHFQLERLRMLRFLTESF